MTDYLFRGKTKEYLTWAQGLPYFIANRAFIKDEESYEVLPETVGMFSEVYDKNNIPIFEGDIVSGLFMFGLQIYGVAIRGNDGSFGVLCERMGDCRYTPFTSICNVEFEIVGNIYDNVELIGNRFAIVEKLIERGYLKTATEKEKAREPSESIAREEGEEKRYFICNMEEKAEKRMFSSDYEAFEYAQRKNKEDKSANWKAYRENGELIFFVADFSGSHQKTNETKMN